MPRNQAMMHASNLGVKGRTSNGRKPSSKIVIRPYSKPPALPENYYAETVQTLLQGTLSVLQNSTKQQQQPHVSSSLSSSSTAAATGAASQPNTMMSLQTSYTAVVTLVRHQYGPQLYADWMASVRMAVMHVLPSAPPRHAVLHQIPIVYQQFTEYLVLCKHIFLPLDRTHMWNAATQTAIPTTTTTTSSTSNTAPTAAGPAATSSAATYEKLSGGSNSVPNVMVGTNKMQSLWNAGLAVFRARLVELQLEMVLYEQWLSVLLQDWSGACRKAPPPLSSSSGHAPQPTPLPATSSSSSWNVMMDRQDLQAVWYMWQDLGLLSAATSPHMPSPPLPLQRDLEQYWMRTAAEQWQQCQMQPETAAQRFLERVSQQHAWPLQWQAWLPVHWLWHILDTCLTQPILTPQQLLNPRYLHPLLQQTIFSPHHYPHHRNTNSRTAASSAAAAAAAMANQGPALITSMTPMQQLWLLASRLPTGHAEVAAAIGAFAKAEGVRRLTQHTVAETGTTSTAAVAELLALQSALQHMISTLPTPGPELISLKSVWEEVVNATGSLAEALAKFLDNILRNPKKLDTYQQEDEQWMQKIIAGLFVPLAAKDVFEAFYKRDLAKRLLWNRISNSDVEKQVCSLLKAECGAGYTSKMEGMFQDIDLSRENMLVYKQSSQESTSSSMTTTGSNVEMDVQILTTGYWPVYPQFPNLHLPDALTKLQEQFDAFYKKKCHGRRITWQYALGHCILRTHGFAKPYELVMSLCQAVVLMQFASDHAVFTLPQLMQQTGLDDRDEMERILQSLALGKEGTRILRKLDYEHNVAAAASSATTTTPQQPPPKKPRYTVHDDDQFRIQTQFHPNQLRIRITNIMAKETKEEREKTVEAVSRDRLYLMDAVLVRILKARKTIMHQQLIPQVLEQVKFPAQAADVKQRIESLIEREYMERDAKDRNRYNYLA